MFRISRSRPWPPTIDLSTMRETLAYMQGDAARLPGLERVATALQSAITEIEAAERAAAKRTTAVVPFSTSRFLPRRR